MGVRVPGSRGPTIDGMPAASSPDTPATRTTTLSEADSKSFLSGFDIPFAPERMVASGQEAAAAAEDFGTAVAAKLCGTNISHKTERGLVRLGLGTPGEAAAAATELLAAAVPEDGATGVLVAPMVSGDRELIAGAATDPQFGPTVLVGVGGVLAEAVADVAVRLAPITELDAAEMIEDLRSQSLLGHFRGEPEVDRAAVVAVLMGLSNAICDGSHDGAPVSSIDLNPLIISKGVPVAVDALVELAETAGAGAED